MSAARVRLGGSKPTPHPLDQLSICESDSARQAILNARGPNVTIHFRSIYLEEPPKKELSLFLDLEHAGRLTAHSPRPARIARVQYDVVKADKKHEYTESMVDVVSLKELAHRVIDKRHQAALTTHEFKAFAEACITSPLYKKAIAELDLPEGFVVCIDPWPYGGPDSKPPFACQQTKSWSTFGFLYLNVVTARTC